MGRGGDGMGGKETEGREREEGREGKGKEGEGREGEKGEDVQGPGKWSAPGPALAFRGPAQRLRHSSALRACS